MWTMHDKFAEFVQENWPQGVYGNCLSSLVYKLKRLKGALKFWNKEVFGDVKCNITKLQDRITEIDHLLLDEENTDLETELEIVKGDHASMLTQRGGVWHWKKLIYDIPQLYKVRLQNKFKIGTDDDKAIWEPAKSGDFTIKAAWDFWRIADTETNRLQWIWHKVLSPKIQVFNWKIWKCIIPVDVDDVVGKLIYLPSKCSCCLNSQVESIDHLLVNGDMKNAIWGHFSRVCGVRLIYNQTYWARQGTSLQMANKCTQMGVVKGVLPAIICWKIWTVRCKFRYEEVVFNQEDIIMSIINCLQDCLRNKRLNCLRNKKLAADLNFSDSLSALTLKLKAPKPVVKRMIVVRWLKPPVGYFKLNTDGSSVGNSGGEGGIVRNHGGVFIFAFSADLGMATNTAA
ncbi:hypothetical protein GIB67_001208 [Kingdonia uniflora]|uniref:Reverse transcriptase zinc-binding domain-containing protein n=1 Tax=Kingdonia uniflora TaxID=39325 RepID=A0A7J7LG76_9MAGN|nr:hypothetical protein GIB67_001208 [Kingdonia uniflora]